MTTPARRQYLRIKSQYPDAILMYQVGDFYETFDEDARIAARELQIVLTSRKDGEDGRVPLAGVPCTPWKITWANWFIAATKSLSATRWARSAEASSNAR